MKQRCLKARNRAAEIVEEITIRMNVSLKEGLVSRAFSEQLQDEASRMLECIQPTNKHGQDLSTELREAAVIKSIELVPFNVQEYLYHSS